MCSERYAPTLIPSRLPTVAGSEEAATRTPGRARAAGRDSGDRAGTDRKPITARVAAGPKQDARPASGAQMDRSSRQGRGSSFSAIDWVRSHRRPENIQRRRTADRKQDKDRRRSQRRAGKPSCGNCRARTRKGCEQDAEIEPWTKVDSETRAITRPGAGAAPGPKARTAPHEGELLQSSRKFPRLLSAISHHSDAPAGARRQYESKGFIKPSFTAAARKLVGKAQQEIRAADNSSSSPPLGSKGLAEGQLTSSIGDAGKADDVPDASPEFRSEFAALLAYYAARVAAARRGLPANEVFATTCRR